MERRAIVERTALERATAVVDQRMEYYVAALRGLGGLVEASDKVTRAEFGAYVGPRTSASAIPGVQALELTLAVDAAPPICRLSLLDAGTPTRTSATSSHQPLADGPHRGGHAVPEALFST
ncbi:MAG: hypothetical protein ACR2MA_10755 [Egibacteraceae bacterium]